MSSTTILYRQVGKNGPSIPAIGLGLMGMSVGYGPAASNQERLQLLDHAWEMGCRSWDTADCYGDSEVVIGMWFKLHPERRKDIFLATKFCIVVKEDGTIAIDSSPEHCRQSIEQSLSRLGQDYVDLYYIHRPNTEIPIEVTMRTMKTLVEEGKIRNIGLSEVSARTLRRAHAIHPIAAVQIEYNPWSLEIEDITSGFLKKTCDELGVAIFAYSPFARGLLTGACKPLPDQATGDYRGMVPRFQGDNFDKNTELVKRIADMAASRPGFNGSTAGQLALAWLLAQGDNIFVLPGTKTLKYLEQNFAPASQEPLTGAEEKALRSLVTETGVAGDRGALLGSYIDTVEENQS